MFLKAYLLGLGVNVYPLRGFVLLNEARAVLAGGYNGVLIMACDASNGTPLWAVKAPIFSEVSGGAGEGNLYFVARAGEVFKMTPEGALLWSRRISGLPFGGEVRGVDVNSNGTAAISGFGKWWGAMEALLLLVDKDGNLIGSYRTQDWNYYKYGYAVKWLQDGDLLLAGCGSNKIFAMKVSPGGSIIWSTTLFSPEYSLRLIYPEAVDEGPDGSIYLVGDVNGGEDAVVIKLSANGSFLWAERVDMGGEESFKGVCATSDGGCLATGYTDAGFQDSQDGILLKFGPDGSLEWARSFGDAGSDDGWGAEEVSGDYLVLGQWGWSYPALLRTDAAGSYECIRPINPQVLNMPMVSGPGPAFTSCLGIYITDYPLSLTSLSASPMDVCSPLYQEGREEASKLKLKVSAGKLSFTVPAGCEYELRVYNPTGRGVWRERGTGDGASRVWSPNKKGIFLVELKVGSQKFKAKLVSP